MRNEVVIMRTLDEVSAMNFIRAKKCFSFPALCAIGALLCLCFSLGAHSDATSKTSVESGFPGPHSLNTESTVPAPKWPAESVLAPQGSIRGAMRDKHSPPHPADVTPERMSGLFLKSSQAPLNNFADIRSLIFLSPLQDRAPPRFV
jgi:hypothetical protein